MRVLARFVLNYTLTCIDLSSLGNYLNFRGTGNVGVGGWHRFVFKKRMRRLDILNRNLTITVMSPYSFDFCYFIF